MDILEIEKLKKYILEDKLPYNKIGEIYGISGAGIKKRAKALGIQLPVRRHINSNENFSHIGERKTSLVNIIDDNTFITIINNANTWKDIANKLGYKNDVISSNVKKSIINSCNKLGIDLHIFNTTDVSELTKGELFNNRITWQSARTAIQKLAKNKYFILNPEPKCIICGYNKHVEIAHIKAVSDFDDSVKIKEINDISNLMALCPNHHWEYDHGLLEIHPKK